MAAIRIMLMWISSNALCLSSITLSAIQTQIGGAASGVHTASLMRLASHIYSPAALMILVTLMAALQIARQCERCT